MSVRRRHGAKTRTHAWDAESVWRVIEDATRHEEISGTLPRYLARQLIKRVKETIAENIRLRQLLERGEPSQGEGQHDSPTWPYVLAFAEAMEEKLAANRHKGDREGWLKDSPEALFARLEEETRELLCVLESSYILSKTKVLHEAADVANFAMMIADVCGGLDVRPEPSGGKG